MEEKKIKEIKPDEIYIINKKNFADQAKVLAKICMTLEFAKREPIDPDIFMEYVTKGLAFNQCIIFITFDNKLEISSCVVIFIKEIPVKGRVVWIEWAYSNGKDLELSKKVFDKINEFAKDIKASRIAGAITRGEKALFRRYGLEEAYIVVERKINKEGDNNVEKN